MENTVFPKGLLITLYTGYNNTKDVVHCIICRVQYRLTHCSWSRIRHAVFSCIQNIVHLMLVFLLHHSYPISMLIPPLITVAKLQKTPDKIESCHECAMASEACFKL